MKLYSSLSVVCLICFSCLGISAQKTSVQAKPTKPNQSVTSADKEQEKQIKEIALSAVGDEIDRAKRFDQMKDRIMVWAAAADVLWDIDSVRAKGLLRDSYALIEQVAATPKDSEKPYMTALRKIALQSRMRGEILSVAQKHDPGFLKELMKDVKEDPQEVQSNHDQPSVFGSSSFEKQALASLASQLATTDPEKSVQYAINSLGYGVPQEFGEIFKKLIATNPTHAKQLFAKSVEVYSLDNALNLYDAMILTSYLRFLPAPESDTGLVQKLLDTSLRKSQAVLQKALASEKKNMMSINALITVNKFMYPYYQTYWVEKLPEVNSLLAQANPQEEFKPDAGDSSETDAKSSRVEALIERAEKADKDDEADALYFEAGLLLARQKNFARSLDVIGRAKNDEKRLVIQTYVFRQQAEEFIKTGDLFEAAKVIKKIKEPEYIAELTVMFTKSVKKQDKWLGVSVLEDAKNYFESNAPSAEYSRAYLWLASAFANFDDSRAFDLMYSAIKSANKARELDDIRSETKLVSLGGSSNKVVLTGGVKGDFRSGFARLARKDLNQALTVAQTFDNQLLKSLAVIASAEAVLIKPKKT
jgi:hypothetical protein